ncbi:MAG: GMC family oxidoreductase [Xanthomonadales bacterium]|nr:GMC family oxidoreductase [Xanthomonadales bacterium]
MLIDLQDAAAPSRLEADVCVVGGGAAGVAIARKLADRGHDVCLLEAGGTDFEQATQDLCSGENIGMEYYELDHSRLRFFGGTTNIWGGRSVPLNRIDFEKRDWVPHSGWPVTLDDLEPYYRIAHDSLELGEYDYSGGMWEKLQLQPIAFDADEIAHMFWRFDSKKERFNSHQIDDLINASNVRIVLHANVVHIQADDNGQQAEKILTRTLDGRETAVHAKHIVLACGAIENARLLMLSDDVEKNGIGNGRDQVGRYFMEHPHGRIAHIETEDPGWYWAHYRKRYPSSGPPVAPALVTPESFQRDKQVLNSAATFKIQRDPKLGLGVGSKVYQNLKHDLSATQNNRKAWHFYRGILDWLQKHVSLSLVRSVVRLKQMELYLMARAEQAPNPDSRVLLSRETDALGCRRGDLDWQLTELDKRTVRELARAVGREFERLGLGTLSTSEWLEDGTSSWPVDPTVGNHPIGGYHHMGTTRMSDAASEGVVDANCTVHGYRNLHIAGSSVFTTSGWANPTLTILALGHRLGDHIDNLLREPG